MTQPVHTLAGGFNPADYVIYGYYDNQRPMYTGNTVSSYEQTVEEWTREMVNALGAQFATKIHRCAHCGNGRVRYITVCEHRPTGERVVLGADCTHRLEFDGRDALKLDLLRRRAEATAKAVRVYRLAQAVLDADAELAAAFTARTTNAFIENVYTKLYQYGAISDAQRTAVIAAAARDAARAVEVPEPTVTAPEGRLTVTGTVVSIKAQETMYGYVTRATIKVTTPEGYWMGWGTAPSGSGWERGQTVAVTATFTRSTDKPHFAFYKHPRVAGE
jgi:hypothetical protein